MVSICVWSRKLPKWCCLLLFLAIPYLLGLVWSYIVSLLRLISLNLYLPLSYYLFIAFVSLPLLVSLPLFIFSLSLLFLFLYLCDSHTSFESCSGATMPPWLLLCSQKMLILLYHVFLFLEFLYRKNCQNFPSMLAQWILSIAIYHHTWNLSLCHDDPHDYCLGPVSHLLSVGRATPCTLYVFS